MKIGIIGSGGREHAISFALNKSNKVEKIFCFPGNAGTSKIATNVPLNINDFESLKNYIQKNKIDLIIVGPEEPLVNGIVDYLEKFDIKVFGPNKISSQLEGSKIFTKKLCEKYGIPTANFGVFKNLNESLNFLKDCRFPIVIKADGLAAGKGVYICENYKDSEIAVKEIFDGKFGKNSDVLIEEFLKGEEMSFFIISDGKNFKKFETAQDHKRVLEGDKGKNTGGMGAYSPSRLDNKQLEDKIIKRIIKPTLKGIENLGTTYKGFLYAGLMIVKNEPYLIEYNVRMGDPECQTILPRLKSDFFELINNCLRKKLNEIDIDWYDEKSLSIVLCSKGYPDEYKKNIKINFESINLKKNEFLFHAGTKNFEDKIVSDGGRVLNFVALANNFKLAKAKVLKNISQINWKDGFYRKDIGYKVIDE